jgi:L-asparaginase II
MANPVLVEVVRGSRIESRHRGSVAVVDADGTAALVLGDVARPVFPRSAVKPLQALVLVESGAADRFGFAADELALASASHAGEPAHVAGVGRMLARAGLDAAALACGAHPPGHAPSAQALARAGREPSAIHNNCSGKHAGFLCAACALGADPKGYIDPAHPVQRKVKAVLEGIAGVALEDGSCAIDGCSVPTWPVPLERLALAFARFGTGVGLDPQRAGAAARIRDACAARPHLVAGTGRFCTRVIEHFGARVLVKGGAEGMLCGALPQVGLGIAIKCDDGAGRAADVVMAAMISRLLALDDRDRAVLDGLMRPALRNWNGIEVGALRPTGILLQRT